MQPCKLKQVIDAIETLEHRISGQDLLESRMLPTEHLLAILAYIGKSPAPKADQGQAAPRQSLSTRIEQIIDAKVKTRQHNHLLSMRQASLIHASEQIFFYLEHTADVDPLAFNSFQPLLPDVARLLLSSPEDLKGPEHPVRRLMEILLKICGLYDAYSGRRADRLMEMASELTAQAVGRPLPLAAAYETATRELLNLFNEHNQQSLLLSKNLIAKEQGQSLRDDAKLKVNREMLETLKGRRLPRFFVEFLERVWSKYMYVTYLRHGIDDRQWNGALECVRILADSLNIRGRDEMFRYYGKHLSSALAKVREAAFSIHQDEYLVQRFLEKMDAIHLDIMDEREPDFGDSVLIKTDPDAANEGADVDADSGFAPQTMLRAGDWYKLEERGLWLRCKLIERNRQHGYCLFTNLSGIKVGRYSFIQIAEKLHAGSLRRLGSPPLFQSALENACKSLQSQLPNMEQKALEAEQTRRLILERQHQAAAAEKLHQMELDRQQREEQERRERILKEQEQQRIAAEKQAKAQRQALEQAIESTTIAIGKMQSGGWLEILNEDHQRISCKLGLRIKSSGKLIFVDSLGRKVMEFLPRQLAERIVDGSAAIVDFGVAFDETLGNLIVERSEKIKTDEQR